MVHSETAGVPRICHPSIKAVSSLYRVRCLMGRVDILFKDSILIL